MTPTASSNDGTSTAAPFSEDARDVLGRVCAAFRELVASTGGARRPTDLQRVLGIDYTMSWRLFRIVEATDPLVAGPHVPGSTSLRRLLAKASRHGVAPQVLASVAKTGEEFESLVRHHAADRRSFDTMVAAVAGQGERQIDLESKRAAFRANCRIYGVQLETRLTTMIVAPGDTPDFISMVSLRGQYAMRRLRPNAPLLLARHAYASDCNAINPEFTREPLDPQGMPEYGVSVLTEFGDQLLPQIKTSELSAGNVQTDLVGTEVGIESQVTCVLGDVGRNIMSPYLEEFTPPRVRHNTTTRAPTEVLVHDSMIPADLFGPLDPKLFVFTDTSMLDLAPGHEQAGLLPIQESVTHLGRGLGVMHSPDVPRYAEMLRYTFERLGCDPERFEVYRSRVEFPVMRSVLSMQFYLPLRS